MGHAAQLQGFVEALAAPQLGSDVAALGAPLLGALGARVPGLIAFKDEVAAKVSVPSTPAALWLWLRGKDRGDLVWRTLEWQRRLEPWLVLESAVDAFTFRDSRDLSGYVDGTENPVGEAASEAVFLRGQGAGLDGGCFVAVQHWVHQLKEFLAKPETERDDVFGRRLSTGEEFESAPEAAHVKRAARESFPGSRFMLRRSMPWSDANAQGLEFVSFSNDLQLFATVLRRMTGAEDGMVDHLFGFSRPVQSAFFWCPPLLDGHLDLRALAT
jgi:putative iron-dependent peroxidase